MKKLIKNANDFVLAVLMLALSLFLLLYPNITSNIPSVSMGGYFTRPDVYIRMLALFLAAASLALLIRSLNLGRKSIRISFYNQQHRHHDGGRVATVLCFAACGRFLHLHRCDPSVP